MNGANASAPNLCQKARQEAQDSAPPWSENRPREDSTEAPLNAASASPVRGVAPRAVLQMSPSGGETKQELGPGWIGKAAQMEADVHSLEINWVWRHSAVELANPRSAGAAPVHDALISLNGTVLLEGRKCPAPTEVFGEDAKPAAAALLNDTGVSLDQQEVGASTKSTTGSRNSSSSASVVAHPDCEIIASAEEQHRPDTETPPRDPRGRLDVAEMPAPAQGATSGRVSISSLPRDVRSQKGAASAPPPGADEPNDGQLMASTRQFSVRLNDMEGNSIHLRFLEKRGEMQLLAKSSSEIIGRRIVENTPHLSESLDRVGYRPGTWKPHSAASRAGDQWSADLGMELVASRAHQEAPDRDSERHPHQSHDQTAQWLDSIDESVDGNRTGTTK